MHFNVSGCSVDPIPFEYFMDTLSSYKTESFYFYLRIQVYRVLLNSSAVLCHRLTHVTATLHRAVMDGRNVITPFPRLNSTANTGNTNV